MVLDFGTNTTITIAKPLMGKIRSSKCRVQHIALGKWLKEKYNSSSKIVQVVRTLFCHLAFILIKLLNLELILIDSLQLIW